MHHQNLLFPKVMTDLPLPLDWSSYDPQFNCFGLLSFKLAMARSASLPYSICPLNPDPPSLVTSRKLSSKAKV